MIVSHVSLWVSSMNLIGSMFLIALGCGVVGKNTVVTAAQSALADVVPNRFTGTISSYYAAMSGLGCVLGFAYEAAFPEEIYVVWE